MDVSIQQLYQAYRLCYKGKAKTSKAQQYSGRLLDNLYDMQWALQSHRYQAKPASCFVATNGSKPREIHADDFADRVKHHFLVPKLEAIISDQFIYHSCANQKDKGTHFGVNAVQKMMRKMLAKQANYLADEQLQLISAHKQLRNIVTHKGLSSGNLSSQFFANVYMNALDQFVKHSLKVKYYVRFVDDFVLLCDKAKLIVCQGEIEQYLQQTLALFLKDEIKLMPIQSGANFYQALQHWQQQYIRGAKITLTKQSSEQLQSCVASYLGHLNHAKSNSVIHKLSGHFQWFDTLFKVQCKIKTHAQEASGLSDQWFYFKRHFDRYIIVLQKGCYWLLEAEHIIHLPAQVQVYCQKQGTVQIHAAVASINTALKGVTKRHGCSGSCKSNESMGMAQLESKLFEIPLYHLKNSLNQLEKIRLAYVLITEQGYVHNRLKQRKLSMAYLTASAV